MKEDIHLSGLSFQCKITLESEESQQYTDNMDMRRVI